MLAIPADAPARIRAMAEGPKLLGLRPMLQDLDDDAWILRPELAPALDAMEALGLTFEDGADHIRTALEWEVRVQGKPVEVIVVKLK